MKKTISKSIWYGEYHYGFFKKSVTQKVIILSDSISGTYFNTSIKAEDYFKLNFDEITSITKIEGTDSQQGIKIHYEVNAEHLKNPTSHHVSVFGFDDCDKLIEDIMSAKTIYRQKQEELARLRSITEEEKQKDFEKKSEFYNACFNFHISQNSAPFYTLHKDTLQIFALYIGKDSSLNFLNIDGINNEEACTTIPYDKLHYYEKAGNIHYISTINTSASSFGGSFSGATFSKPASLISGILLGPMGMLAGALFSHKPATSTPSKSKINIQSTPEQIDARNVILNYFSDKHGQFIDIELPADTFNFLQTHLPNKKYAIVIELEKTEAVQDARATLPAYQETPQFQQNATAASDDINSFRQKVEKLKIMHEAGFITNEEFDKQKSQLMKQIV